MNSIDQKDALDENDENGLKEDISCEVLEFIEIVDIDTGDIILSRKG